MKDDLGHNRRLASLAMLNGVLMHVPLRCFCDAADCKFLRRMVTV